MAGLLTAGCLIMVLAAFHVVQTATPAAPNQHIHLDRSKSSSSKVGGRFRIVDEDSCSCKTVFQACPIKILEQTVKTKRGSPCPPFTWYCCQRETILHLPDLINRMSTIKPQDPIKTTTKSSLALGNYEPIHPPEHSLVTPAVDAPSKEPTSGYPDQIPDRKDVDCSTDVKSIVSPKESTVEEQNASISAPAIPAATNTFAKPEVPSKRKEPSRKPKMIACSCTSMEDCASTWALIGDLPEVKIKTALTCEDSGEVICCLGQVLSPRKSMALNPQKTNNTNTDTSSSGWSLNLSDAWQSIVSWINGNYESHRSRL